MKIAISGKGGVGKTTITALTAREFQRQGKKVTLIDVDPSPHMAQTIGLSPEKRLTPLADMKTLLAERAGKQAGSSFYQLNPQVDDLLKEYLVEHDEFKLMVLGAIQTAESGCACPENHVLRKILKKLLLKSDQIVMLDMEAGVEHLGRGTIVGVDHLVIVAIPSQSSIRTALKIYKLASEVDIPNISFVGNLIREQEDVDFLTQGLGHQPIAFFPDSQAIRQAERKEAPITAVTDKTLAIAPTALVQSLLSTQTEKNQ